MTAAIQISPDTRAIWDLLETVMDPEVPVLSVIDLGIIRDVRIAGDSIEVDVSPTYTGCPATALIHETIKAAIDSAGMGPARIRTVLSPAWTTDWISEAGRQKLQAYGIAPPVAGSAAGKASLFGAPPVIECPKCGSRATEEISQFGSTACKAMYRCTSCLEPFEYFKCI